jgi:3',5'-nucleoside bisphosphate phosphatase
MKKLIVFTLLFAIAFSAFSQVRKEINIPNIPGYLTLKCDFHMHTIFSDGEVWPTIRVHEAWRDGLDVISITDHLNYKWSFLKDYVKSDDGNAPYNTAKLTADRLGITLIKGTEINRGMPPGHFNVLFATDINQLNDDDFFKALEVAKSQGAFIQWNHPGFGQKIPVEWFEVHDRLYKQGLLHGIEVYNKKTFFPFAVDWANDKKLTITSGSDEHKLIDLTYEKDSHRPITLVFAKENTVESIREAMFAGRTAAYFENQMYGHTEHLTQLFNASVSVIDLPMIIENNAKYIQFKNNSFIDYELELLQKVQGVGLPGKIKLEANSMTLATIKPGSLVSQQESFNAKYRVVNLKSVSGDDVIVEFTFNKISDVQNHPYKKEKYPEVR